MSEGTRTRRAVLKAVGSVALAGAGTTAAAAKQTSNPTTETTASAPTTAGASNGVYSGTVDRIVDGEHVVILVESGGRVIDQYVLSQENYSDLDEGQQVTLWLFLGRVLAVW
jgi:hypothetical protein